MNSKSLLGESMREQNGSVPNLRMPGKRPTVKETLFSGKNGLFTIISFILAGSYMVLALGFPSSEKTMHALVTLLLLASASYEDIRENRIPVTIIFSMLITGIIHSIFFADNRIAWVMAIVFSALMLAIHLMKKEAVGVGDIMLLGLCMSSLNLGSILGFLFLSFLLSSVCGIMLIALKRNRKSGVPMAPCITLAWLAVTFIMN